MLQSILWLTVVLLAVIACGTANSVKTGPSFVHFQRVYIEFGENIGNHVQTRLFNHIQSVCSLYSLEVVDNLNVFISENLREDPIHEVNTLLLSFGNANLSLTQIPPKELRELSDESYRLVVFELDGLIKRANQHTVAIAVNGLPLAQHTHKNITFDRETVHYGAVVGSYAVLELLGFAFLHPLEPYIPSVLRLQVPASDSGQSRSLFFRQDIVQSPYWPERGFHIHTQHPLELTEVLQGHDIPQFGPHGPACKQFSKRLMMDTCDLKKAQAAAENQTMTSRRQRTVHKVPYCERWEDMVIDVDYFYEWSVANRLNKVEWLLLGNYKWGDEMQTRLGRLKKLTHLGHKYSLLIGADIPVGNVQQHGWYIVNVRLPIKQQIKQIQERVDLLFKNAQFDFLTTESGLSEFTHPECDLMLDLLNAFAKHVNGTWGREAAIKVHCSTGQKCESVLDPRSGDPINFNFLPTFADSGLGVFPHTVQVYALDDPTAGAYGNDNFSYVEDYLVYEAKQRRRAVMFYGETAYWVNVDIDVPLFLPIYGARRLRDLRKIAVREIREDFRMDGQMNFDSGWEWGYWLSDVVTARASWDPFINATKVLRDDSYQVADDEWVIFGRSLEIFTKTLYGPVFGAQVNKVLVDLCRAQAQLLIFGRIHGRESPNLKKLSGIAYLSGWDTWTDIPRLFGLSMTQPNKVHLKESDDPDWPYVLELLDEMDKVFQNITQAMDELFHAINESSARATLAQWTYERVLEYPKYSGDTDFLINDHAMVYLWEIKDAVNMLWLRARQVKLLYESREAELLSTAEDHTTTLKEKLLNKSRKVLETAADIVSRREDNYRVSWERIASWRDNPTVYRHGYLWSVHSLFYWWRDQGIAEGQKRHSPCYLNRIDSSEVAVGWGRYTLELLRTLIHRYTPFSYFYPLSVVNCLSSPAKEYEFPRDLHVTRR